MKADIYNKVRSALTLYIEMWIVATLLAWVFVSIFGYNGDEYATHDFFDNFIWYDYTWGDFCFDGVSMALLIGASMVFNTVFINVFKPLQDYRGRAFLYSILLLAINAAASILITRATEWFCGEMPHNEFVNCTYMCCLVATLISSIHANFSFQRMYMRQQQEKHELELRAARQEEASLQASLMALKTQVDPHFLFNNFSILSDLIDENTDEAKEFLGNLSRVYRFKLVNMNVNLVDVVAELKMVRAYVHLLEGHYGKALNVEFPADEDLARIKGMSLPPLAVQLAVENAVKHNARSTAEPLTVKIETSESRAIKTGNGKHEIVVTNAIRPLSSKVESTGMGLRNLAERYILTCGCQPLIENDGKCFRVRLPLAKATKRD